MKILNKKKQEFRIKLSLTIIFLFIIAGSVLAQKDWEEKLKGVNGVVIEQRQDIEISITEDGDLQIISKVFEETQHLSENANLYSEQSIGFSQTFTEISDIEAYSLVTNGKNRQKKIPVKEFITSDSRSAGIFYDDHKKISYTFPALKAGSKTVISYTKEYKEPRLWGYYLFSSSFPVEKSVFTVKAPAEVELNYIQYGIDDEKIHFKKEKKGKNIIYQWSAEKLDRIRLSKGSNGVLQNAPHLIIYVDLYEHDGVVSNVLRDVNDLHAWYQNFLNGIEDDDNDGMKSMVDNIVKGKATEIEKVEAIYYWVQQNIKYIAIEDGLGGFRPRGSNTVFTRRYGDCKDMSNLIHNMLNLVDIPSNLAWIGTTSIPYSHKEVPTPMTDNHMICTYKNNNKYYFLDATDQYNKFGIPTSHIQGKEALVNKGVNDFELVNVPVVPSKINHMSDSLFINIDGSRLNGTGQAVYSGYNKIPVANSLENMNEENKKTFLNMLLKKGNNKFKLNSVETKNVSEKNEDLIINYDFSIDDYIITASDEIYLNPHFDKELENDLIDISTTHKDIHNTYKRSTSNKYYINIPDQFTVTYLPENSAYKNEDFGYSINYQLKDNRIYIHQEVEINTLQIKMEQFESWNTMIRGLFSAYKESVVLGKI